MKANYEMERALLNGCEYTQLLLFSFFQRNMYTCLKQNRPELFIRQQKPLTSKKNKKVKPVLVV